MSSLESFQLFTAIPEQVFLPSNNLGGPVNFFIPSQPPILPCLPPTPYTFLPGPSPFTQFYPNQEIHPYYEYPDQNFLAYSQDFSNFDGDFAEMKPESTDSGDDSSCKGASYLPKSNSQKPSRCKRVEQLKYTLRDIYRVCDAEQSLADCQAVLEILGNSNSEFLNLCSNLMAMQEKANTSSDSESPYLSLSEQTLNQPHNTLVHSPTHSSSPNNNSTTSLLNASYANSPFSDDIIDIQDEVISPTLVSHSSPNESELELDIPDIGTLGIGDINLEEVETPVVVSTEDEFIFESAPLPKVVEKIEEESIEKVENEKATAAVPPIVDPPQQLWSHVIQRKISHNSSRGVSPTPWLPNTRNRHTAYTTISNQRIELGPGGFSTIYPSGVDHRVGQQSQYRAIRIHEKLSSSNKRRQEESRRSLDDRLAKAYEERNKKREEMTDKMRLKHTKVKEIQASKDEERKQKRLYMQAKLDGANDRRNNHIEEVKRKAQDEEHKVNCINLINQIDADNRKLELHAELRRKQEYVTVKKKEMAMSKKQHNEQRIQSYNERKCRNEAELEARLAQLVQERRARDVRRRERREMQEKARQEEAHSKEETIERKKAVRKYILQESAHFPQLPTKKVSSRKKSQKAEPVKTSTNNENIQKIFPPSFPYLTPKICKICNTKLHSELYLLAHFRSSRHHEALENIESSEEKRFKLGDLWFIEELNEAEDTKSISAELLSIQKSDKKKAKKLKLKLEANFPKIKPTFDFSALHAHSSNKVLFSKIFSSLSRILSSQVKHVDKINSIVENIRQVSDIKTALRNDTKNEALLYFFQCDGLAIYGQMFSLISSHIENHYDKITPNFWAVVQTIIDSLCFISKQSKSNCTYIVADLAYVTCIDIFLQLMRLWVARWGSYMLYYYQIHSPSHDRIKKDFEYVGVTETLSSLFNFIIATMNGLSGINNDAEPLLHEVCLDLVNYALSIGLMDQIFVIFNVVCGPMENTDTESIVLKSMEVLAIITCHLKKDCRIISPMKAKQPDSPNTTIFSSKLKQFPSMNVTSLLYSIILHSGPPKPLNASPRKLSEQTIAITIIAFQFISNAFLINHSVMQTGVGSDETRVNEFKLLVSYLMVYSKYYENQELLDLLILSVGYFVLFSVQNQDAIQSGRLPTILQHLVDLPFKYFSSTEQKSILFPTLIAATYQSENNRDTLKRDVNLKMLTVYIKQQLENVSHKKSPFSQFDLKWRFPIENLDAVFDFYGIAK